MKRGTGCACSDVCSAPDQTCYRSSTAVMQGYWSYGQGLSPRATKLGIKDLSSALEVPYYMRTEECKMFLYIGKGAAQ